MTPDTNNQKPQIAGYDLIEKLGAGGYGEVWSARVPGGMTKAVKIIYGRQDEARAASELKALERIREVRHPFVVSLERVELADGRMIVVSELADGSLRDRFRECIANNLPGIPRDELLAYLKEIADALDFLTDKHELQHLDIKPENLLLLAGHAKLADFGLVKSVSDNTQSLVGGMTPTYAAPEVFQGTPTRQSDQYSLAVLYQEMLTGHLPFNGENAAELTLQHMNDDPELASLGKEDHFAISRALSKNPDNRYESCSEFVLALTGKCAFSPSPTATLPGHSPVRAEDKATELFDEEPTAGPTQKQKINLPPLEHMEIEYHPAPTSMAEPDQPTPALFIGIGGTAAVVLRELRQRLSERFELSGPLPTMPMLLLDTDQKTLLAASRNSGKGAGLTPEETVCLPLRRPQEYREKSAGLLRWLGRRWLYNIPKSQKTEGIRPLGRLALIDHARQAFQRIRRSLADSVSPESLAAAKEATGVDFKRDSVRVYVVASAAGGTGSGMSLDVAYAVRTLLKKMGLQDAKLIGVVPTSTSRAPERGELARVNTFAWIAEHQHYSNPNSEYHGDTSCGLPGHDANVSPFDATYLASLGNRLDEAAFSEQCRSVADFLYLDASPPTQMFLDACREEKSGEEPRCALRTFAVNRIEAAPAKSRRETEQLVINNLLDLWLGESPGNNDPADNPASTDRIVLGAGELVGKLKLDSVSVATQAKSLVEDHLASVEITAPTAENAIDRLEQIKLRFESDDQSLTPILGSQTPHCIYGVNASQLANPLTQRLIENVAPWVLQRLEQPGNRLSGAMRAAGWFRDHAESLLADFHRFAQATRQKLSEVVQQAAANQDIDPNNEDRYFRLQIDLVALECAARIATGLSGALSELTEGVMLLKPSLSDLKQSLRSSEACCPVATHELLAAQGSSSTKLVQEIDTSLQQDWIEERGGLARILQNEASRDELKTAIRRFSQQAVREALLSAAKTGNGSVTDGTWPLSPLFNLGCHGRSAAANPGGNIVNGPNGKPVWTTESPDADSYLLIEAGGLSAPHVAVDIVGGRRDYADFAHRVFTRRDVDWKDLVESAAPEPAAVQQSFTMPMDLSSTPAPVAQDTR